MKGDEDRMARNISVTVLPALLAGSSVGVFDCPDDIQAPVRPDDVQAAVRSELTQRIRLRVDDEIQALLSRHDTQASRSGQIP